MSFPGIWAAFGPTITTHPGLTLAAFLGHAPSREQLARLEITPPCLDDAKRDPVLDPNPHNLDLSQEYLGTSLLVRSLALWGWQPLVRAAAACGALQMARQATPTAAVATLQQQAMAATNAFVLNPEPAQQERARQAAKACADRYAPFEDAPDSNEAREVWRNLGAPWFAAESAAEDHRLSEWDGPGPTGASATWGNRNSVWPQRAADAAAEWSSFDAVEQAITTALLEWTLARP